jgi:hypothetical protein
VGAIVSQEACVTPALPAVPNGLSAMWTAT